jgi:hypothetical protein
VGVVVVVIVNVLRLFSSSFGHDSYSSSPPSSPAPRVLQVDQSDSKPSEPGATPEALVRQLAGSWSSIETALDIGDCQTVREQWPLYLAATRVAPVSEALGKEREGKILGMCPELKELLETPP